MAMEGAEGILPFPEQKQRETASQPRAEGTGILGFLRKLGRKKAAAEVFTQDTAQIAEHRRSLSNIAMNRGNKVSADDTAEMVHLNAITELGANLTAEELHRKAILVAQNEADTEHRSLRVEDVPRVEQRLREKQAAKASPQPVGASSKT